MKSIEYEEDRSLNAFFKVLVKGIFRQILMLFGRGLSLGFVLFLALSTLSLLNRGMDFFDHSSKGSKAGLVNRQSFQAAPQISGTPYRVVPNLMQAGRIPVQIRPRTLVMRSVNPDILSAPLKALCVRSPGFQSK